MTKHHRNLPDWMKQGKLVVALCVFRHGNHNPSVLSGVFCKFGFTARGRSRVSPSFGETRSQAFCVWYEYSGRAVYPSDSVSPQSESHTLFILTCSRDHQTTGIACRYLPMNENRPSVSEVRVIDSINCRKIRGVMSGLEH